MDVFFSKSMGTLLDLEMDSLVHHLKNVTTLFPCFFLPKDLWWLYERLWQWWSCLVFNFCDSVDNHSDNLSTNQKTLFFVLNIFKLKTQHGCFLVYCNLPFQWHLFGWNWVSFKSFLSKSNWDFSIKIPVQSCFNGFTSRTIHVTDIFIPTWMLDFWWVLNVGKYTVRPSVMGETLVEAIC